MDNVPLLQALFNGPQGITFDHQGNVILADSAATIAFACCVWAQCNQHPLEQPH